MENNLAITGDEARILMVALQTCNESIPPSIAFKLWFRILAISQNQPPVKQEGN